jgi:hypothetical protein
MCCVVGWFDMFDGHMFDRLNPKPETLKPETLHS